MNEPNDENYSPLEFKDKATHFSIRINVPKWMKNTLFHVLNSTCSLLFSFFVLQPMLGEEDVEPVVVTETVYECPPGYVCEPEKAAEEEAEEDADIQEKAKQAFRNWF